ncbi:aminoglycoside phosphotransferase family protein [Lederbergia sp. NSJ-179]|uniref:aminoglycoside phosphotransferase family protein n=1 Tax=Lederbergia sp. NSJ-179 TaxID=2931402 RepID=UPI001FD30066|nr:aminoglycoside phosphotransferase family protein [Lederbergia sp. NSJ-179]MCJ7840947.1 aminoglycoside phosphotransferase family protein [Lederbergia sp. NSJ-179]
MGTPIDNVNWEEKSEGMNALLNQKDSFTMHPIDQGFEAEVIKINSANKSYVLKIWNKNSKPDIRMQFRLLNFLFEQGLSVSKPLGWGTNAAGDRVLFTTFNGRPVTKVSVKNMKDMANIFHTIHVQDIKDIQLPKYDFIEYFFPGVIEHSDIYHALLSLVPTTEMKQKCMIHGDFHLENILEQNGRYTVIDWTNVQLGDPRYDFAWSYMLIKIYLSDRYANIFRSAYLLESDIQEEELEIFEALACLRWILLNRNGGTPKGPNSTKRVKNVIDNNQFLKSLPFNDFQ